MDSWKDTRPKSHLEFQHWDAVLTHLHSMFSVKISRAQAGVQFEAESLQRFHARKHLVFRFETPDGKKNTFLGDGHSGADHTLEVCLVAIFTKARHLACARHFNTKHDIGASQASE